MNHLQYESSPYLLQHAHNPVDWYAWKAEAFERARKEDKPIIVSIGYSTCHWCHVMERESFENKDVAAFMNEHFINIKVDREERPDVDKIYMEACQIISGSGGWPLNCFLTPDGRPFYAGTYFPPRPAHQRPSWIQVLQQIYQAFHHKRQVIEDQANQLINIIKGSDNSLLGNTIDGLQLEQVFQPVALQNIFHQLKNRFDVEEGGFGSPPKFPSTMSLQYLLNYYHFTGEATALKQLNLSLHKMIRGGIYDQIGGGFARYSTDRVWLVPHFEKMLYDNALLVSLMANAYKLTEQSIYRETIEETLAFIKREMTHPEGGFYAALDADSEGVEGKFYVWDKKEFEATLPKNAHLFSVFYDLSESGNWEGHNILRRPFSFEAFAQKSNILVEDWKKQLKEAKTLLLEKRSHRIRPGLDDKILLDWNALMCSAYVEAYKALQKEDYRTSAIQNLEFLLEKFQKAPNSIGLYHTYKDGKAQYDAFFDDYAFLIAALIDVYSITFQEKWLAKAKNFSEFVVENFLDVEKRLFYFTAAEQKDIVVRRKDLYDSALPSGNSTMVHNLQKLGILLDKDTWRQLAKDMLVAMQASMERYPSSFARWATAMMNEVYPIKEIAVVGKRAFEKANDIHQIFMPNQVIMATTSPTDKYPLLAGKPIQKETLIYVCQNYSCQLPVRSLEK